KPVIIEQAPKLDEKKGDIPLTIIDLWKLKLPSVYIMLPPEFVGQLGAITIAWGQFDKAFNTLIDVMRVYTGNIYKGLKFFNLEQRVGIFEKEAAHCFSDSTEILQHISKLIEDIKALQIARNALVHGRITLRIDDEGPALIVKHEYKNQSFDQTFNMDAIH